MDEKAWELMIGRFERIDASLDDIRDDLDDLKKFRWIHAGVIIGFSTIFSSGVLSIVFFVWKNINSH